MNSSAIAPDVRLGKDVQFSKFINLYGCEIGDGTKIGAFVEIQKNAKRRKELQESRATHSFAKASRSRTMSLWAMA